MSDTGPRTPARPAKRGGPRSPGGLVPLGTTGLQVSRLGFGCYRVDDRTLEHRAALEKAIAAGCTLIDTSTNYTDGGSERLVGEVLADLERQDPERRRAMTVVSKIGYVQGGNLDLALGRESEGHPFPEMVKYADGCWHCIHPDFLRDQLTRSRARLRVESLDVCLLHNPEYFLSNARKGGGAGLEESREEFYRRLGQAFAFLEERTAAGEIRWYGVSSNSAVAPAADPEATSVTRIIAAAESAAGPGHHLRVLQIPMNLFESGGALVRNTGPDGRLTALEAAAGAGLGVLINRPLNAFVGNRLIRLAGVDIPPQKASLNDLQAELARLETEHRAEFGPRLSGPGATTAEELFQLVGQILDLADQTQDPSQWSQIEHQYVIPRINYVVGGMARALDEGVQTAWRGWWERFLPILQDLLAEIGRRAAEKGRDAARTIAASLDPHLPPGRRDDSLSRKALWILASTPGVSSVLVGMRRQAYVEDAMAMLAWPPLTDALSVYDLFRDDAW